MTKGDRSGRSGGVRTILLTVGAVLLLGIISTGCASLEPRGPEETVEASPDQKLVQAFKSQYEEILGDDKAGLPLGEATVDGESLILPGYSFAASREFPGGLDSTKTAATTLPFREARGVLLCLSDGSLDDYEGRNVKDRIILIEPSVTDLGPALHQARLFGVSAVVAAPREAGGEETLIFATSAPGFSDPGIPVFFLFPSGAALLREREGKTVMLRFPVESREGPWRRDPHDTGSSDSPGFSGEAAGEMTGGVLFLPEQRREGEVRIQALRAALAKQDRVLALPWTVTGLSLDLSPEEWVEDILRRDRRALPPLPWDPLLAEAWRRRRDETAKLEFYDTVLNRVEEWNLREISRQEAPEGPYGRGSQVETVQLSRDLSQFWRLLELNQLNRVLTEGIMLMESGREEVLPRLFAPYLLSARAVPRFDPEAVALAEQGSSRASWDKGQRWLPDLGDLFLCLHLGLQSSAETRLGMIRELKYWENQSAVLLGEAEDRFLSGLDDLLSRIDRLEKILSTGVVSAGS